MDNHSLVEMVHMLHRICSAIVDGECWLVELPRKFPSLDSACLVKCPTHHIISHTSGRLVLVFALMVVFLFI